MAHDDVIKWKHFPRYPPSQRPVARSFDVFIDLNLNKRLRRRWFETPSRSLLSGEPDYFGRNKVSSGGDLSHYSSASLY